MLKLENAMSKGVHSRKGGYGCLGLSEESDDGRGSP